MQDESVAVPKPIAKDRFQNGGANLRVCCNDRRASPAILEMTFSSHYNTKTRAKTRLSMEGQPPLFETAIPAGSVGAIYLLWQWKTLGPVSPVCRA